MEQLTDIHYERYYRELIDSATLIHEVIEGETSNGDIEKYYWFDDAESEAYYEDATLSEYGSAFYFKDGKVYECIIYFEDIECVGVNVYTGDEVKEFVQELLDIEYGDEEEVLYKHPWAKDYL